nr:retrotransposon Orf1 [Tanacetum cinerariifolium]
MASQDARLSNFKSYFKQHQGELTNKIDTVLKAIIDRITRALLSDTVKNPKLNVNLTSPVLSARSYPTKGPQRSTRIYSSIKSIIICPKKPNKSCDDESKEEEKKEKRNSKNINTTLTSPHDPSISFITEKVCKLNSFLESSNLVPRSSDTKFVCTKDDRDVVFIIIISKYDYSHEEGPEDEGNMTIEGLEIEYFNTFSTRSELAYHKVVKFTDGINEIANKMPHKIEQYNLLSNLEKDHTKSVYLMNEEDKRRGVEYVMNKILGFYK